MKSKVSRVCKTRQKQIANSMTHLSFCSAPFIYSLYTDKTKYSNGNHHKRGSKLKAAPAVGMTFQNQTVRPKNWTGGHHHHLSLLRRKRWRLQARHRFSSLTVIRLLQASQIVLMPTSHLELQDLIGISTL